MADFNANGEILVQSGSHILTADRRVIDATGHERIEVYGVNARGDVLWENESTLFVNDVPIVTEGDVVLGGRITRVLKQLSASINDFGDVAFVPATDQRMDRLLVSLADRDDRVFGDFDHDGALTTADIDALSVELRSDRNELAFDVNLDRELTEFDRHQWIRQVAMTDYGDSNLDRQFNSQDLLAVFALGQYEDDVSMNSGWASGDWNGDGEFDSRDWVVAFQAGGFAPSERVTIPVPESMACQLILIAAAICWTGTRNRRRRHEFFL